MRILPNLLTAIKASNFGTKVVISASNDIYTNLAMEDWIYTRMKEINEPILMLWRNNPCIVIGRHQNPWLEARLKHLEKNGVVLARRNSGGGTVYHDMGNLNCTFFTDKKHYSRKSNLEFLCSALKSRWPLDIEVSSRDDIILQQKYKISGTAAKLGRCEAYHHLTVLFNANKEILHDVLRNSATPLPGVESKATRSVAAPVKNLTEVDPSINYESLIETITRQIRVQDEVVIVILRLSYCNDLTPFVSIGLYANSCVAKRKYFPRYNETSRPINKLGVDIWEMSSIHNRHRINDVKSNQRNYRRIIRIFERLQRSSFSL
ncbi:Lipoyltransferase 1, mitochondrial, variant 2 [Chamberlinius hualienensis]